ncbi:MAG: YcgN family cysteine cluster protein [Deltaproteobacteria bacterium]|nr:YcgN family cysteine cluster protein [Deltaproteobacteria bacterium]
MEHPQPFWKRKALDDMTRSEWESLCDRCGRCCLHKLEIPETGKVIYTSVACRFLDLETCLCCRYADRKRRAPGCLILKPETVPLYRWLPKSCAYRRLSEGRGLEWWHHLISGDFDTVHEAGISVRDKAISEKSINKKCLEAYAMECDI